MRKNIWLYVLVAFAAAAFVPALTAEEEAVEWKNLQVFPQTMSKEQLKGVMKGFTQQLGVECTHCHIKDEYDKDEKEPKLAARNMVKMMRHLRDKRADFFPEEGEGFQRMRCWTCHRGQAEPEKWTPPED